MKRFESSGRFSGRYRLVLSLVLLFGMLLLFSFCIDWLNQGTAKRQKENLEAAIADGITYCYAMDGAYPENLEELESRYGLVYDKERFFVDYKISGANLYPDVTIIERGE